MALPLAISGDLLQSIVFAVIALIAWSVKAAVERKEAKRARDTVQSGKPSTQQDTGRPVAHHDVDVVFEKRPLPPAVRPTPRRQPPAQPAAPTPAEPARARVEPKRVPATAGPRGFGDLGETTFKSSLSPRLADTDVQAPMVREDRRQRAGALDRLGVPPGRSAASMLRAGILWSEVLGAPRGVRGPHRSPAARRLRP